MKIKDLLIKYKSLISYGFFGVLTTLINLFCYKLCYSVLNIPNVYSTAIAWLFAVLFAFVTNKLWVFESKSWAASVLFPELVKFFVCRIATGALDILIMWVTVDKLNWNSMLWKFLSNVIVIILNYAASKLVIFVKKQNGEDKTRRPYGF